MDIGGQRSDVSVRKVEMVIHRRQRGGMITAKGMVETLKNDCFVAELVGPNSLVPTHVAPIDRADENCLSFYIGDAPDPV